MLEQLEGYDWEMAFQCCGPIEEESSYAHNAPDVRRAPGGTASLDGFQRKDVEEIRYIAEGENDGPSWLVVGKLFDERWFALSAGCDYTGWDCQSGGCAHVALELDEILRFGLDDHERDRLGVVLLP